MATSYSDLFTDIQEWSWDESVELSGQIPRIIQLGQQRLRRDLPTIAFDVVTTGTFSGTGSVLSTLTLPDARTMDRYFMVTVSGSSPTALQHKTVTYLAEYWPNPATTGTPRYYAQKGPASLRIAPTPVSGTTWEWGYRAQLADLSTSNETNWLTSNAQDALLQACLVEAARFKQDQGLLDRSEAAYQISKAGVIAEHIGSMSDDFGGTATPRARE